jgi:hypothetical protein
MDWNSITVNGLGLAQKVPEVVAKTREDSNTTGFRAEISTSFCGTTAQT